MLRKVVPALVVMLFCVGITLGDEFACVIKKIDGNKLTLQKTKFDKAAKKVENDGDPIVGTVSDSTKFVKAKFDKDTKKMVDGDPLEGGLKNDVFTKIDAEKGLRCTVTIDDGKISKIAVAGGKKAAQ
jgi:hypothetical protein